MNNEKTAETEKPKKTKAAKPVETKSAVLGLSASATAEDVEKAYKAKVAQLDADKRSNSSKAQVNAAKEIAKLTRERDEARKPLKKAVSQARQVADKTYQDAKAAAKSAHQSTMDKIDNHETAEIEKLNTTFNGAAGPIETQLKNDLAKFETDTSEGLKAATAEYQIEKAKAVQRAKDAAEAATKAAAEAAAAEAAKKAEETKAA